ncbi:MAG: hypothetical protein ACLRZO_15055, partial [Eggerthella lenta]
MKAMKAFCKDESKNESNENILRGQKPLRDALAHAASGKRAAFRCIAVSAFQSQGQSSTIQRIDCSSSGIWRKVPFHHEKENRHQRDRG